MLRLDDIHRRENAIRDYLQMIDTYLARVGEQAASNLQMLQNIQQQVDLICKHLNIPKSSFSVHAKQMGASANFLAQSSKDAGRLSVGQQQQRFNDQRLQPFTAYAKPKSPHAPFKRGLSVDVGELLHLRAGKGRIRHYSVSKCEGLVPAVTTKSALPTATSDDETGERRQQSHVCFKDMPEYLSDSGSDMGASSSNVSASLRPSTLKMVNFMPLTPIVTPNRIEYTSITDDIDTSCVQDGHSPPDTPLLEHQMLDGTKASPHKKGHHHRHRHNKNKPEVTINEGLKNVEENENQQMEVSDCGMVLEIKSYTITIRIFVWYEAQVHCLFQSLVLLKSVMSHYYRVCLSVFLHQASFTVSVEPT